MHTRSEEAIASTASCWLQPWRKCNHVNWVRNQLFYIASCWSTSKSMIPWTWISVQSSAFYSVYIAALARLYMLRTKYMPRSECAYQY